MGGEGLRANCDLRKFGNLCHIDPPDFMFEMNIVIVRAFIALRQFALNYKDLEAQIQSIWLTVNSHDEQLKMIYSAIESLLAEKDKQKSWEEREMIGLGTPPS